MKGDFSRLTFDPSRHYAGVLHQQGRVWLDADWNEDVASRLHLLRQTARDVIGVSGAPAPGTAFGISPHRDLHANAGDFRISGGSGAAGHYYVDGMLCQLEHDAQYLDQPDLPEPDRVAMPADGEELHALIYLEAWERLVTYLEDAALREPALGGPDTSTRLQTMAQVKVLPVRDRPDELRCDTAPDFLPRDSHGTLTTVDSLGYTGRVNRLYRVEIHNSGEVMGSNDDAAFRVELAADAVTEVQSLALEKPLSDRQRDALLRCGVAVLVDTAGRAEDVTIAGIADKTVTLREKLADTWTMASGAALTNQARFKWSRDNAAFAVGATFSSGDRSTITLSSLGRDQITQLREGDLVEICSNATDLGPGHGHLTYLTKDPDPDDFSVTIAYPLPRRFQPPGNEQTHGRYLTLRRWDGVGWADARDGDTASPDQHLGDGVRIRFGGGNLLSGDYWQFAARVADGAVEEMKDRAPRGIRRHRAPLAIVRWQHESWYNHQMIDKALRDAQFSDAQRHDVTRRLKQEKLDLAAVEAIARQVGASAEQMQELRRHLEAEKGERHVMMRVLHDCRKPFAPLDERDSDCTVSVAPDESLSAALQKIGATGGVICLQPGTHYLRETITVAHKHGLTIRGSGAATVLAAHRTPIALQFEQCSDLTLCDFQVSSGPGGGAQGQPIIQAASPGAPDRHDAFAGVFTFVQCHAVHVRDCTISCAPLEDVAERTCIAFRGDVADVEDRVRRVLRFSPDTISTDAPQFAADDLLHQHAARLATSGPAHWRGGSDHATDLTVRDCRLYAGREQGGLLIAGCLGAMIEDTWLLPLADLESVGATLSERVDAGQRGGCGVILLTSSLLTLANNAIIGFQIAAVAEDVRMNWHHNRAYQCAEGLIARQAGSLWLNHNVIVADRGPAMVIESTRGDVTLESNVLTGMAGSRSTIAAAEIIAPSALLAHNRFHAMAGGELFVAVGVAAHTITYASNRSICDEQPNKTNVFLHALKNGTMPGRGTVFALGNLCVERKGESEQREWPRKPEDHHHHGVIGALIDAWEDVEKDFERIEQGLREGAALDEPRRVSLHAIGRAVICETNMVSHQIIAHGDGDRKELSRENISGIF